MAKAAAPEVNSRRVIIIFLKFSQPSMFEMPAELPWTISKRLRSAYLACFPESPMPKHGAAGLGSSGGQKMTLTAAWRTRGPPTPLTLPAPEPRVPVIWPKVLEVMLLEGRPKAGVLVALKA